MAYGQQQNVWGARSNSYGDEEKGQAFGSGMGGNSIRAVGGGFKEKNTLKMIGKTAAQIVGTVYGGPAGGMAAGMAVDAMVPDKKSVKSGTSGFGSQSGSTGQSGTSMRPGGSSNMGNVATLAAQGWDKYQAGQKAAGPLADEATQMALDENTADLASNAYSPAGDAAANSATDVAADGTADAASGGAGNAVMWAKAAYDVSNKLNESGVTASEAPGESKFNMDASTIGQENKPITLGGTPQTTLPAAGPLGNPSKQFDEDEYMRKFGGMNYGLQ